MPLDISKLIFTSQRNYQKVYINDSGTFSVATTAGGVSIQLATHNLGYVPTVRVYYEPIANQIWPISRDQYDNFKGGPGTTLFMVGSARVTTTGLFVDIINLSGSPQNVKFYWRVYLDA